MEEFIWRSLGSVLPGYSQLRLSDLRFTQKRSGSNKVYVVEAPGHPQVIFRKFGVAVPRESEHQTFEKVAAAGLGPACLAYAGDFRVEEFLPGTALPRTEIHTVVQPLARKLATLHGLESGSGQTSVAANIQRWAGTARTRLRDARQELSGAKTLTIEELTLGVEQELDKVLALVPDSQQLVLCHNDVSYTNILRHAGGIHLLDYEYAGLNNAISDLAYLANEATYEYQAPPPQYFRVCPEDELTPATLNLFLDTYNQVSRLDDDDIWRTFYRCRAALHYSSFIWAASTLSQETETWYDFVGYARSRLHSYHSALDKLP